MSRFFKLTGWMFLTITLAFYGKPVHAGILTFPGPAPCDTTLQACINGANAGDTVEIATNERIDDPGLNIDKSLTLKGADGFFPVIGKANPDLFIINRFEVFNQLSGFSPMNVVLDHINFDNSEIQVFLPNGSGHHFELKNCRIAFKVQTAVRGINIIPSEAMTFLVEGNTFLTSNTAVLLKLNSTSGVTSGVVQGNSISTQDAGTSSPSGSREGIAIEHGSGRAEIDIFNNLIFDAAYSLGSINLTTSGTADLSVNIKNNTINNIADVGFQGQGIYFSRSDTSKIQASIFNNIFSNLTNYAFWIQTGFPDASLIIDDGNNDFFNLELGVVNDADFTPDASNLTLDPLYQDAAAQDFRLAADSQLIDAGNDSPLGGLPDVDVVNQARLVGAHVDIGAFETKADLSLAITVDATSVVVGDDITYTLTATNGGSSDANGVHVTDTLPAGTTFVSATPSQGSCTGTLTVDCDLGVISRDAAATITLVVTANQVGVLTNTASVRGDPDDPSSGNNDAAAPDVTVASQPAPPSSSSGGCALHGDGQQKNSDLALLLLISLPLTYFTLRSRRIGV